MAKMVKKHSSKQGWFSKLVNVGLWVLTFSTPLRIAFAPQNVDTKVRRILKGITFGFSEPPHKFNLELGLEMYLPGVGAAGLNELKKYAMRHYPVR